MRFPGPFTALFPTNDAFYNVDPKILEFLLEPENILELQNFLLYHILPGATFTTAFTPGPSPTLLANFPVEVSFGPDIMFDDSNLQQSDVSASNGLFNVLDTVLDPLSKRKYSLQYPAFQKTPLMHLKTILLLHRQQNLQPTHQSAPISAMILISVATPTQTVQIFLRLPGRI